MKLSNSRRDFILSLGSVAAVQATAATRGECFPAPASDLVRTAAGYVNPRRVLLWESTRKEIREALETGRLKAAIVPTGSTEQHNEHLAMIHDTASAVLIAQQAALALYPQVTVATPVPVGISPYWMERKGTLTLRRETFLAVVFDLCDSLRAHGIKTILILNGHGGNEKPLKEQMEEFRQKLGVNVEACSYWEAYAAEGVRDEVKRLMETGPENVPGHSGEFETSVALAAFPERVHREGVDYEKLKLALKDPEDARNDRKFYYDSLLARAEKGEVLIRIAVDWVAARLRSMMERS